MDEWGLNSNNSNNNNGFDGIQFFEFCTLIIGFVWAIYFIYDTYVTGTERSEDYVWWLPFLILSIVIMRFYVIFKKK